MTKKKYFKEGVVTPDEQFDIALKELSRSDQEVVNDYIKAVTAAFRSRSDKRGNGGNTLGEKSAKELILKVEAWKCKNNLPLNCTGE